MATGAYDANGIWQYGEDDNIALFSDLLKLGTASTSSAFTADRARLATLEAGSLSGLIPLKPTTITPVTGSAAMNSIGTITVTGISKLEVNGVFTSNYAHYKIVHSLINTTNTSSSIRYRRSGVDVTTGYYGGGLYSNYVGTLASSAVSNNGSDVYFAYIGTGRYSSGMLELDLTSPSSPQHTFANYGESAKTYYAGGGGNDLSGAGPDGFTFQTNSGLATGTFTIYGYND